jgi:hypothetical protein
MLHRALLLSVLVLCAACAPAADDPADAGSAHWEQISTAKAFDSNGELSEFTLQGTDAILLAGWTLLRVDTKTGVSKAAIETVDGRPGLPKGGVTRVASLGGTVYFTTVYPFGLWTLDTAGDAKLVSAEPDGFDFRNAELAPTQDARLLILGKAASISEPNRLFAVDPKDASTTPVDTSSWPGQERGVVFQRLIVDEASNVYFTTSFNTASASHDIHVGKFGGPFTKFTVTTGPFLGLAPGSGVLSWNLEHDKETLVRIGPDGSVTRIEALDGIFLTPHRAQVQDGFVWVGANGLWKSKIRMF